MGQRYKIVCDPVCGFEIVSHDEKEAVRLAMSHAAHAHEDMNITTAEMKKMVKVI